MPPAAERPLVGPRALAHRRARFVGARSNARWIRLWNPCLVPNSLHVFFLMVFVFVGGFCWRDFGAVVVEKPNWKQVISLTWEMRFCSLRKHRTYMSDFCHLMSNMQIEAPGPGRSTEMGQKGTTGRELTIL